MSEGYYLDGTSADADPQEVMHAWQHMAYAAQHLAGSAEIVSNFGMFIQLEDTQHTIWTLSAVPTAEVLATARARYQEHIDSQLKLAEPKPEPDKPKKAKKAKKKGSK